MYQLPVQCLLHKNLEFFLTLPPNACAGSDSLISRCLWEFGVAPTDPGHRFFRRPGSFDPDLEMTDKVVWQLRKQTCYAPCQVQ